MKDKEKQIEDIKRIIDNRCEAELGQVHASSKDGKVTKTVDTKLIAKDIYEYLNKDSVVLSREEYDKLLKIKEDASVKEINYFSNLFKLQKELEQVEKERDSAIGNCDRKGKERKG